MTRRARRKPRPHWSHSYRSVSAVSARTTHRPSPAEWADRVLLLTDGTFAAGRPVDDAPAAPMLRIVGAATDPATPRVESASLV